MLFETGAGGHGLALLYASGNRLLLSSCATEFAKTTAAVVPNSVFARSSVEMTIVVDATPRVDVFVTTMAPFGHAIPEQKWGGTDSATFGTAESGQCQHSNAISFRSGSLDESYGLQVWRNRVYRPVAATHGTSLGRKPGSCHFFAYSRRN